MKIAGFLCVALAGIATVVDQVTAKEAAGRVGHDKIHPFSQPLPTTIIEKTAIKFKPLLKISGGCHAYPAVTKDGHVSGGLKPTGPANGDCKGNSFGSQVYGRSTWYEQKYAIAYAWYFPKEQRSNGSGHRHGWQTCIVWLDNPENVNPKILAVSVSGFYKFAKHKNPTAVDGTHVKVLYFRKFSGSGRGWRGVAPRRVTGNEVNHNFALGLTDVKGGVQDLILWHQLTEKARCALNLTDWGSEVKMPINDKNFWTTLKEAFPFE